MCSARCSSSALRCWPICQVAFTGTTLSMLFLSHPALQSKESSISGGDWVTFGLGGEAASENTIKHTT